MSKLPEIGKKYKNLGSNRRMEVRDGDEDVCFFCYDDAESERSIPHYDFWSEFEELPDQEPIKTTLIEWIDNQDINIDILSPRELIILISEFYENEK